MDVNGRKVVKVPCDTAGLFRRGMDVLMGDGDLGDMVKAVCSGCVARDDTDLCCKCNQEIGFCMKDETGKTSFSVFRFEDEK